MQALHFDHNWRPYLAYPVTMKGTGLACEPRAMTGNLNKLVLVAVLPVPTDRKYQSTQENMFY